MSFVYLTVNILSIKIHPFSTRREQLQSHFHTGFWTQELQLGQTLNTANKKANGVSAVSVRHQWGTRRCLWSRICSIAPSICRPDLWSRPSACSSVNMLHLLHLLMRKCFISCCFTNLGRRLILTGEVCWRRKSHSTTLSVSTSSSLWETSTLHQICCCFVSVSFSVSVLVLFCFINKQLSPNL